MKAVGEGLKLLNWFTKYFGRKEYHERVEESLIATSDGLIFWLTTTNKKYDEKLKAKKIRHFVKQYKINRKKLR